MLHLYTYSIIHVDHTYVMMCISIEIRSGRLGYPSCPGHICLGQVALICFIKYPGLAQILNWITCANNGVNLIKVMN